MAYGTVPEAKTFYVHKHAIALCYGGPEEGGWWYTAGVPVSETFEFKSTDEEMAYVVTRALNEYEYERREKEERYDFTSVLANQSEHFQYSVEDYPKPVPFPEQRPHYE